MTLIKSKEKNYWPNWAFDIISEFMETLHVPVLLAEAVESLQCRANGFYLDATLGSGGHALKILKDNPEIKGLIALDCDEDTIQQAQSRLAPFSHKTFIFRDNFINIKSYCKASRRERSGWDLDRSGSIFKAIGRWKSRFQF